MDVVKTRIAELNGAVDVSSAAGKGTTFTIRLPLTLAIIRSLLFRVRHGVFAAPIDNVREIVAAPVERIVSIHGRRTFDNRGEFLPLVDINEVFQWPGNASDSRVPLAELGPRKRLEIVILQAAAAAKVVMVSAVDQKEKLAECIKLGAIDFLVKPFDKSRLRSLFEKLSSSQTAGQKEGR